MEERKRKRNIQNNEQTLPPKKRSIETIDERLKSRITPINNIEINASDPISFLVELIMIGDSYHDFKGDRAVVDDENKMFTILNNIVKEKYTNLHSFMSRKLKSWTKLERSIESYFESILSYKIGASAIGDIHPKTIRSIDIEQYTTSVLQQDSVIKFDFGNINNIEAYYSKCKNKLFDFFNMDIHSTAYFTFDADHNHVSQIITLDPTYSETANKSINLITLQSVLDPGYTDRTAFGDENNKYDESYRVHNSNYFTRNELEFYITNADTGVNDYIYNIKNKKDNNIVSLPFNILENKNGPSVAYLSNFEKCANNHSTPCPDFGNKMIELDNIILTGWETSIILTSLFDIKRMGDHEQANALYNFSIQNHQTVFVTGDILSCLYSRILGNNSIFIGNKEIVCFRGDTMNISETQIKINDNLNSLMYICNVIGKISSQQDLFDTIITQIDDAMSKSASFDIISKLILLRAKDIHVFINKLKLLSETYKSQYNIIVNTLQSKGIQLSNNCIFRKTPELYAGSDMDLLTHLNNELTKLNMNYRIIKDYVNKLATNKVYKGTAYDGYKIFDFDIDTNIFNGVTFVYNNNTFQFNIPLIENIVMLYNKWKHATINRLKEKIKIQLDNTIDEYLTTFYESNPDNINSDIMELLDMEFIHRSSGGRMKQGQVDVNQHPYNINQKTLHRVLGVKENQNNSSELTGRDNLFYTSMLNVVENVYNIIHELHRNKFIEFVSLGTKKSVGGKRKKQKTKKAKNKKLHKTYRNKKIVGGNKDAYNYKWWDQYQLVCDGLNEILMFSKQISPDNIDEDIENIQLIWIGMDRLLNIKGIPYSIITPSSSKNILKEDSYIYINDFINSIDKNSYNIFKKINEMRFIVIIPNNLEEILMNLQFSIGVDRNVTMT